MIRRRSEAPSPSTPCPSEEVEEPKPLPEGEINLDKIQAYMGKKEDFNIADINKSFCIPNIDLVNLNQDEKILLDHHIKLIRSKERLKSSLWNSTRALDEKKIGETIIAWKFGSQFLEKFVESLGGKLQTINKKTPLPRNLGQKLIFILGPKSKPDLPTSYIELGAQLHSTVHHFITHTMIALNQVREGLLPSSSNSSSGNGNFGSEKSAGSGNSFGDERSSSGSEKTFISKSKVVEGGLDYKAKIDGQKGEGSSSKELK